MMRAVGKDDLASELQSLTQVLLDNQELDQSTRKEVAEQLEFLVAQIQAKPENRTVGLAKSALSGIRDLLAPATTLIVIWNKLEPLIKGSLAT